MSLYLISLLSLDYLKNHQELLFHLLRLYVQQKTIQDTEGIGKDKKGGY